MNWDKPDFHMHLVESNSRKCAFLREVARTLGLSVTVHDARAEAFLAQSDMKFDVVSARALAPLSDLLDLASKLLTTGTVGLFLKGQDVEAELTQASKYWNIKSSIIASKTDPNGRILKIDGLERIAPAS
jgi:16S rRNA (guanine527-N7)-methyltransferase